MVPTIKEGSEPQAAKDLLSSKPPMDVIAEVGSESCPAICDAASRGKEVPIVVAESAAFEDSAGSARYAISWPRAGATVERGSDMTRGDAGDNIFVAEARNSGAEFSVSGESLLMPVLERLSARIGSAAIRNAAQSRKAGLDFI
jgi:hypothetical protein